MEDENFCYECGLPIVQWKHFCDSECRKGFVSRVGRRRVLGVLAQQTKLRRKQGLPRFQPRKKSK